MQKPKIKFKAWTQYVSVLVITSLALIASITVVNIYSNRTVQSRVYDEMQKTTAIQADIIRLEIEEQFMPLNMLAKSIRDKESFCDGEVRSLLDALITENKFCTLGFADITGIALDYLGKPIGDISERYYFTEIMSGERSSAVEYLPITKRVEEPRFIFSVPVYDSKEVVGVIFASKKASVISDVLLNVSLFDGSERLYITDENFTVLAANGNATNEISKRDLTEEFEYVRKQSSENHSSGGFLMEDNLYVTCNPMDINGWKIVCVLDKDNAESIYSDITGSMKSIANTISFVLTTALIYTVLMARYRISHYKKGERQMFSQYSTYRTMLEKMNCAFVEYHVESDTLTANRFFMEKYAENEPFNRPLTMQKLHEIHPEFNFNELDDAINLVLKTNQPYTFETAITFTDGNVYWIEITSMPQSELNGQITEILAAVVDTTATHQSSDNEEVISNTPNGIHRCYLCEPIHMEFASKGMCLMLGYTEEEFGEKLTADRKLGRIVHPDDLDVFKAFITKAAKKEGRYHCQYRMQKKDGSYITVLDVMEVRKASSGVMYGYSSVTDITAFHRAEELANAKLRAAEEEIEKHITMERKIIAAKEEEHRQEVEELEDRLHSAQLKNSMGQMQSHFLYNALASIREIVLVDPQYASDLILDFSVHLRACIRAMSNSNLVPFSQELDNINAYVNIEKMRFGDKLRVKYEISDKDFYIVPLSIQPLVENAIRHGIYERGAKGGTVTVSAERLGENHVIRVADDGVGFDYPKMQKEIEEHKRDSTGLTNLIFRLKKIMNAEITVKSTVNVGTIITVSIPAEQEVKSLENNRC